MSMKKEHIAARCPQCNRLIFIALNEPRVIDRETRKDIADMAIEGCTIEHLTIEEYRREVGFGHGSPCTDKKPFALESQSIASGGISA